LGAEAKVEENGEVVSPPHQLWGLKERYELSQRGPGQSSGRKWFYCNLISADCLR